MMTPELIQKMTSWDASKGDRIDPVAVALRRLYLRVELCPCMARPSCLQCQNDMGSIETAWNVTEPKE